MKRKLLPLILAVIVLTYMVNTALFSLDETEIGVVLQFGRPVEVLREAGLHWKLPDPIQTKTVFDKRVLVYDPTASEFLTGDKQNIVVDMYLCWKIIEPLKFLQAVRDRKSAELRLEDIVRAEAGAVFGNYPLTAFVSDNPAEMRLQRIMDLISQKCDQRARHQFGIEVVDVKMKRLNFPDENKPSVFARMWAERERIAKKYRSEGQEVAAKIKAEAKKQKEIILSEAYKEAEKIKGEGDAGAMRIYAEAFGKDPGFYKFLRTLQCYEKFLDEKTTILLPGDTDLLELLEKTGTVTSHGAEKD
ncbi:MAG: protease modulator HflC [Deltaproteobacteria bacterium]|nr:protease modulator HflC [Deltaproteobacteria bacterium]MBW2122324.1 protease modulator HflC [Deltaproteobacteria bacterium]